MEQNFFWQNRQRLVESIEDDCVIVLTAYSKMQQRADMAHRFLQESNFWYLTGIEESDWQLIVEPGNKSWLVAPSVSDISVVFDGALSPQAAQKISGVDAVVSQVEAADLLRRLAKRHPSVATIKSNTMDSQFDFVANPAISRLVSQLQDTFQVVMGCQQELANLRAIKQPEEIELIQAAVSLTVDAFSMVKDRISQFNFEYEIEAEFSYYFRRRGAEGHAYDPIVGAGSNAVTLHYNSNNDQIQPQDLVLLDIGARVNGYSADITRTYAKSQPTERQNQMHQEVKYAHEKIVNLLRPGLGLHDYQQQVNLIMKDALNNLGLIKSNDDKLYRKYFPHAISHGLGVDVHDSLGQFSELKPGMVLTVEPGIYIPEENIGIRLEDDILITPDGYRNLSESLSLDV